DSAPRSQIPLIFYPYPYQITALFFPLTSGVNRPSFGVPVSNTSKFPHCLPHIAVSCF
ncbi:unnamed protein product, partial [Sphenostylis stenocarpa]